MGSTRQRRRGADRARRVLERRLAAGPSAAGRAAGSRWGPRLLRPYARKRVLNKREGRVYECTLYRPHALAEAIDLIHPRAAARYAVNIGAGDGISCDDPVYPLFAAGWPGVAIEGAVEPALVRNLPATVRAMDDTFVFPHNVAEQLSGAGCPEEPGFLKIDVDGYDGPILAAILSAGYRPRVIQAEIQPEFPPPIEFAVQYDPAYAILDGEGRIGGFYGASLAYVAALARPCGYRVAYMDNVTPFTHDVTLVHDDFLDVAVALFGRDILDLTLRERYLAHPPGYPHLAEYGIDSLAWRHRTDFEVLLEEIRAACDEANLRKHDGRSVPYHLAVGSGRRGSTT